MFDQAKNPYCPFNNLLIFFLVFGVLLMSSCNEQARGFALPEGDVEEGKATFEKLACNACHSVSDIEWKGVTDSPQIPLGGEVSVQKTYGDLVTSVINPSHKIARSDKEISTTETGLSKMKNYNEVMTVQELIDLVTFLQTEYKVSPPPTHYRPYY